MRVVSTLVGILLCIGLFAATAAGYLWSDLLVVQLVDKSAVVAVGRIETVGPGQEEAREDFGQTRFGKPVSLLVRPARLRVELLLKGETKPNGQVDFQFLAVPTGSSVMLRLPSYNPGERWLLFLEARQGQLEPVNPLAGQDLKIPPEAKLPEVLAGSPLERAERLLAGLLSYPDRSFVLEVLNRLEDAPHLEYHLIRGRWAFATPEALQAVVRLLDSSDPRIRLRAARVLCKVNYVKALRPLIETAKALPKDLIDVILAPSAVQYVDSVEALPDLHQLLFDENPKFRENAAYALREIADARSVPYLVRTLDDSDSSVRYLAATALAAATGNPKLYVTTDVFQKDESQIIQHWKEWFAQRTASDPAAKAAELVAEAQEALRVLDAPGPTGPGTQKSEADDRLAYLRRELVRIGPPAVGALLEAPEDRRQWNLEAWQLETIRRIGPAATPALAAAAEDSRAAIRRRAMYCLGMAGDPAAIAPLLKGLRDAEASVRDDSVWALGSLQLMLAVRQLAALRSDPRILPALLEALPRNPQAASRLLGQVGDPRAAGPLLKLLAQLSPEEVDTRSNVIDALGELRNPDAIPALVQEMQSTDERIRQYAGGALERIGAPATDALVGLLRHPEPQVRRLAVLTLELIGVPAEAEDRVIALLDDPDDEVRASAAWQMGRMRPEKVVPALLDHLARLRRSTGTAIPTEAAVAQSLGSLGDRRAIKPLESVLNDPTEPEDARRGALHGLIELGAPGVADAIARILRDPRGPKQLQWEAAHDLDLVTEDPVPLLLEVLNRPAKAPVQTRAITNLGKLRDRRATPVLLRLAVANWSANEDRETERYGLAEAALRALGEIGDKAATSGLLELVTTGDGMSNRLAEQAVIALGKIGDPRAQAPLKRLFQQAAPGSWQQECLAVALARPGSISVIPALKERLKSGLHGDGPPPFCPAFYNIEQAAQALARIGLPAVPVLLEALDSGYGSAADYICLALAEIGDPRALAAITPLLERLSERTRHHGAIALGQLGDPRALPLLRRALRDPSDYVKVGAAEALWRLGERKYLTVITDVLRDGDEYWQQQAAAEALAGMHDPPAKTALREALHDPDFRLRGAAREALAHYQR